jgi:hypothetical protein
MNATFNQKRLVCLDKSFARAVGQQRLTLLSNEWQFVVPSAFYFEVFDTEQACEPKKAKDRHKDRRNTLSGIVDFRRIHLPSLLYSETVTGKPCQEATCPILNINPRVLAEDWSLDTDELIAVEKYRAKVKERIHFWRQAIQIGVAGLTDIQHAAARGTEADFLDVCSALRQVEVIRRIAAETNFPHAREIDEGWLHFRQLQAWALQGLVLWRRHQTPSDLISDRRLEHDLQDIEYLILGMHTGCLATNDISRDLKMASLGWRFEILNPRGHLLTPTSIQGH